MCSDTPPPLLPLRSILQNPGKTAVLPTITYNGAHEYVSNNFQVSEQILETWMVWNKASTMRSKRKSSSLIQWSWQLPTQILQCEPETYF